MEELSRYVSHTLDLTGYSSEIVKIRRNFWREERRIFEEAENGTSFIFAGSKGEGITSKYESDIDIIECYNEIICTDDVRPQYGSRSTVFNIDMAITPPGYALLKLFQLKRSRRRKSFLSHVKNCLYEEKSEEDGRTNTSASSTLFMADRMRCLSGRNDHFCNGVSGPALSITEGSILSDRVFAFHCFCPKVLDPFRSRRRQHNWPPEDIIHDPSSMPCQLVPVGCKGSSNQWKEWRFCFVLTEQKLVFSLNDTQLKMYIILKMVKNDILKRVSSEISSYIMKNVTFWTAEISGSHCFCEENLLSLVLIGLKFLKDSIDNYYLPYYMIPARNLLAERLEPRTRRRLSDAISRLLQEGPRFVLRCTKLCDAMTFMYKSPESFKTYIQTRHTVEVLTMLKDLLDKYKKKRSFDKREVVKQLDVVKQRIHDILAPECVMGMIFGANCDSTREKRIKCLLS